MTPIEVGIAAGFIFFAGWCWLSFANPPKDKKFERLNIHYDHVKAQLEAVEATND